VRQSGKMDRDEVFLEVTRSICPVCKRVLDAEVNARDGQVFLRKRCPEHGVFEARVYGDATMYVEAMRFNKPGTIPLETQTEIREGCPLDCGLCPDHKQHACLGVIEVNSACNLDCPICFADSGHQPDGFTLTDEQVERALDAFVRAEGEPEVVMFSGGEPSIHPRILELLELARSKPIRHVVLNTNGVRLARDPSFAPSLADLDVSIYLQFDGRAVETSKDGERWLLRDPAGSGQFEDPPSRLMMGQRSQEQERRGILPFHRPEDPEPADHVR
jgi:uncharacterized radical SAM superfamily Fe-S cluster-containing enzyme